MTQAVKRKDFHSPKAEDETSSPLGDREIRALLSAIEKSTSVRLPGNFIDISLADGFSYTLDSLNLKGRRLTLRIFHSRHQHSYSETPRGRLQP